MKEHVLSLVQFIIVNMYKHVQAAGGTLEDKMGRAIALAGPAVSMTSVTSCVAFLLSMNASLKAVRTFAVFAAMSLAFDYFMQVRVSVWRICLPVLLASVSLLWYIEHPFVCNS